MEERGKRLVFAGAGHASLIALDLLCREVVAAEIVLVSRSGAAHYSGMVPGWIEGIYAKQALAIPLERFCAARGIRFVRAEIAGLEDGALVLRGEDRLAYDLLVLNTGAEAALPEPLASAPLIPAKPVEALLAGLEAEFAAGREAFALIGAGVGGIEVAFALHQRLPRARIVLVDRAAALLKDFPSAFGRRVAKRLAQGSVRLELGASLARVDDGGVTLEGGERIEGARALAFTGAAPPRWLGATPLARAPDGFLAVDAALRTSLPNVLAVGDVATRIDDPRPKAGVFAVRAGPPLADAVCRWLAGAPPRPVELQRQALVLLATGDRSAIGTRNGLVAEGRWVWRLKHRLDTKFVERFRAP